MGGGGRSPSQSDADSECPVPSPAEFQELFNLVVSFFPETRADPEFQPTPNFMLNPSSSDGQPQSKKFKWFSGFDQVKSDLLTKVSRVGRDAKKPSSVLPRRRASYKVPSADSFVTPPLNDF